MVGKDLRIGFFAQRTIVPGEEITVDYKFERFGGTKQKCHCGAKHCQRFLGVRSKKKVVCFDNVSTQQSVPPSINAVTTKSSQLSSLNLWKQIQTSNVRKQTSLHRIRCILDAMSTSSKQLSTFQSTHLSNVDDDYRMPFYRPQLHTAIALRKSEFARSMKDKCDDGNTDSCVPMPTKDTSTLAMHSVLPSQRIVRRLNEFLSNQVSCIYLCVCVCVT
ncbi:hypothetical protein RFI_18339 [Reticulomyxa filosa]|uniref:Post-SET domain-containing protein n=1 Tax=Reticulomyxa filosa TaxID=46433 RepID=X6N0S2_RETFI|nr:hypothetical protein RFI_18339 [Reticulomyxa filosa]|eukprot:ETO18902.1 hypothetical protein RFI_18339 [Reticulomyxa filosa]